MIGFSASPRYLLTSALLASFAFSAQAEEARSYTKQELKKIIEETIMENPEMIIKSVEMMQIKKEK